MRESAYQAGLIRKLRKLYPEAIIMKNDSGYIQGIPDLTILHEDRWATLEVKAKQPSTEQAFEANQEWYIEKMNSMSYSACIYPENEKDVLDGLQQAFAPRG
ncbi:VRR-Nuc domain protein [Gordonia phage Conley]|uniref:VRR-Nuc domain protein n=1 Tax=Gordonia phage Petito TaxID=3158876 RepID=A0AAU8GSH4_9CAUD|nr:VRR-Nuc domain protein [Gordonia phage Conley]